MTVTLLNSIATVCNSFAILALAYGLNALAKRR